MMRHVRRLLIGTSLLLCIATLALWGRSYSSMDMLEQHRLGDSRGCTYDDIRGVVSHRGSIGGGYVRMVHPNVPEFAEGWQYAAAPTVNPWRRRFTFLGFEYWNTKLPAMPQRGPTYMIGFMVPHGLLAALLGAAPAVAARQLWLARRRRRRIAGRLCVACGYLPAAWRAVQVPARSGRGNACYRPAAHPAAVLRGGSDAREQVAQLVARIAGD